MIRSLLVIVAGCVVLVWAGLAWRRLPNRREFPSDGVHAPRSINQNRGDQR